MSAFTQYSDLYPLMRPELPGCDTPLILQKLQQAGVKFCEDTEAWLEDDLAPQIITNYQRDYTINHGKDATIRRIARVNVNGIIRPPDAYELVTGTLLRFADAYTPNTLDDRMLQCGTASNAAVDGWIGVTDGSVKIVVYETTYSLTGMTFAACTSMADIAQVIQSALRAEMQSNSVHVRWYSTYFAILVDTGTIDFLIADTTGTDISGAGYMNGLTGGDAVTVPYLKIDVVLVPFQTAMGLPTYVVDQWRTAIVGQAMFNLMTMSKLKWSNPARAPIYLLDYRTGLARARTEKERGHKAVDCEWGA